MLLIKATDYSGHVSIFFSRQYNKNIDDYGCQ